MLHQALNICKKSETVFSIWKRLPVLKKASIKIMACAIYTYLFFSYTYTILFCCKTKVIVQAFTSCVHGYNHTRNVHASSITHTWKSVHGIDSSISKLFEFANLSSPPVLVWFYHVLLPVRALHCQLSTGGINLSQLRTTSHPPTQTIMI